MTIIGLVRDPHRLLAIIIDGLPIYISHDYNFRDKFRLKGHSEKIGNAETIWK